DQQLVALLYPLRRYWWAQGRVAQGISWMTIGEAIARRLGADWKQAQAGMAYALGMMTLRHRSTNEAIGYYRHSLHLFQQLQDRQAIAITLQSLGEAVQQAGREGDETAKYFRESLII